MAHIEENGGGREALVELNLVPFIDLMSSCIIFLLITAVWTQVSMIQIGSSVYGKRTDPQSEEVPAPNKIHLRLNVTQAGYDIILDGKIQSLPKKNSAYDLNGLKERLTGIKTQFPDKNDAIISLEDDLSYETLIEGMDTLMLGGFPEIAVSTQGGS